MKPHSGLQLQVLGLYRQALRIARRKDLAQDPLATKAASGSTTYAFVRERFREDASSVDRMNFTTIEHLLRKGQRDLKMLERMKGAHFARVSHA